MHIIVLIKKGKPSEDTLLHYTIHYCSTEHLGHEITVSPREEGVCCGVQGVAQLKREGVIPDTFAALHHISVDRFPVPISEGSTSVTTAASETIQKPVSRSM